MATRKPADNRPVALAPINEAGELIQGAGAVSLPDDDDWQMPVGGNLPSIENSEPKLETATDRVLAMLSSVSEDSRAKIVINRSDKGKSVWCDELTPADYEAGGIAYIRDKFGPGEYVIRLYGTKLDRNGNPNFGIMTDSRITITPFRDVPKPSEFRGPSSELGEMLKMLAEGQKQMLEVVTRQPVAVDPMKQMSDMLTMMTAMRTAMGMDSKSEKRSNIGEIVDAIKELKSAGSLINPPEHDDSVMGILRTIAPVIQAGIQNNAQQPAQPQIQNNPAPPQIQSNGAPIPLPTEQTEMPLSNETIAALQLRGYVAALILMAKTNLDPQKGADLVFDKLPDEWIDILTLDVWWQMFTAQVPEAAPYEEWFTKARNLVVAMLDADSDNESLPPQ